MKADEPAFEIKPLLRPLGDSALLVRFGDTLSDAANRAAIAAAAKLSGACAIGIEEIVPGLVSVTLRFDRSKTRYADLAGEVRLLLEGKNTALRQANTHSVPIIFDGEDLADVARSLSVLPSIIEAAHLRSRLRVLATGFAPGFVYLGFHEPALTANRRTQVRPMVPAGTVLFAAGQTAMAATPIRTGWHVIGHTSFRNFDASRNPPTLLQPGDEIVFEVVR
ncbi:MAG: carboxyltransferase domain-containing protein [Devosia sp.]